MTDPDPLAGQSADAPEGKRGHARRNLWLGLAVAATVPVLVYGASAAAAGDKIPRGTTVAGIQVGGLSLADAQQVLADELAPRLQEPVEVKVQKVTREIVPASSGVTLDVEATTSDVGTTGRAPVALVRGLVGRAGDIDPVIVVDDDRYDAAINDLADDIDRPVRDGSVKFVDGKPDTVTPIVGWELDRRELSGLVLAASSTTDRIVTPSVELDPPTIDQEAVNEALRGPIKRALSGPVTVRVTGAGGVVDTVDVSAARLSRFLGVEPSDSSLRLTLDDEGLRQDLDPDLGGLEVKATNATFRIEGGRPVVVPSKQGRSVSTEDLGTQVLAALDKVEGRVAAVALSTSEPDLTTAEAQQLGVTEQLSTFRQGFPYAAYRFQNIGQAAERVNGTLLLPGETFSLNEKALERTRANGYTTGFVINNGRLTEDLGGGVSTIATTLWDAAFYAGLERVEQRAHSFYISRYKAGLEATVAWGSLDLKFRNNTGNGVFITAERGRNFVTVTMWGTKKWDVTAEVGPRTAVKPFSRVVDSSPTCTPQTGVNGFTVVVTRVIREGGQVIKREPLKTVYRPAANVVCRPAPAPPRPSPPPTPPTPSPSATPGPSSSP